MTSALLDNIEEATSPSQVLILRGYWRSSATWRVRIALHLKKIPFEYIPIHLVNDGGEQHSPEYLKLNPLAQVPTLTLPEGASLTQSLAILDYLDHLVRTPPLYPDDALQRARAIQLAEVINSGIQPLQNLSLLQKIEREFNANKAQWGREAIDNGFHALTQLLKQHPQHTFLAAEHPTIADLCLIPQLYNARRFKVNLEKYPRLLEVEAHCQTIEAFQRAVPEAQPDAQT